jgi:hypothetical protein
MTAIFIGVFHPYFLLDIEAQAGDVIHIIAPQRQSRL